MATMTRYTLMHRDDFERTGKWSLARRSLGLQSFGMNVVDLQPGEQIPEHDETGRDQEEVFIVLSGSPTMVVDGEELPAPAGTFIRLDPEPRRTIVNNSDQPASILLTSAPRTSGYEPMDWAWRGGTPGSPTDPLLADGGAARSLQEPAWRRVC